MIPLSFHLYLHFLSTLQACFATGLDSANLFTALLCSEAFPFVPVSPCPGHNSYRYLMTSVWILYGYLRALSGSVVT